MWLLPFFQGTPCFHGDIQVASSSSYHVKSRIAEPPAQFRLRHKIGVAFRAKFVTWKRFPFSLFAESGFEWLGEFIWLTGIASLIKKESTFLLKLEIWFLENFSLSIEIGFYDLNICDPIFYYSVFQIEFVRQKCFKLHRRGFTTTTLFLIFLTLHPLWKLLSHIIFSIICLFIHPALPLTQNNVLNKFLFSFCNPL